MNNPVDKTITAEQLILNNQADKTNW